MAYQDNYNPAPMNHSMVDRGLRTSGGAATGAFKGLLLGGAIVFGSIAAVVGIGAFALGASLTGAAIAAAIAIPVSFISLPVIGAPVAGIASLFGIGGAAIGAVRGASRENLRTSYDQSLYNLSVAEAVGRGQQQAMYVQPQPQQNPIIITQPTMRDAAPEATMAARHDFKDEAAEVSAKQVPQPKTMAGSPVQYDGTINANMALSRV